LHSTSCQTLWMMLPVSLLRPSTLVPSKLRRTRLMLTTPRGPKI
jgi:hypothetical protein